MAIGRTRALPLVRDRGMHNAVPESTDRTRSPPPHSGVSGFSLNDRVSVGARRHSVWAEGSEKPIRGRTP